MIARVAPEDKIRLVRLLQGSGQRRRDDRRRRERRAGAQGGGHRRGDGDHRDRGLQGGRGDDPHRRQLRDDRERRRVRPRPVRQPAEVPAVPDVDARRATSRSSSAPASSTSPNGVPLNPLQILWLNMVIDIPIAVALGFDEPTRGLMAAAAAAGRRAGAVGRELGAAHACRALVMTVGALVVYQIGEPTDGAVVAPTMLLTTLSLFHLVNALLSRDQVHTIFSRAAIPAGRAAAAVRPRAAAIVAARDRARLPAADPRHDGARLRPVVRLRRRRARRCSSSRRSGRSFVRTARRREATAPRRPTRAGPGSEAIMDQACVQPARPQLPEAARLHARRDPRSCSSSSADLKAAKYGGYEQPRLRGQEHRADLREDVDADARRRSRSPPTTRAPTSRTSSPSGSQIGHKESMKDTARVLGRIYDGIEYRGFAQAIVESSREYAGVPGLERADRRVPPDADPRRRPDDDRAQRQAARARSRTATSATPATTWATRSWSAAASSGMDVRLCAPRAPVAATTTSSTTCRAIADGDRRPAHAHRGRRRGRRRRRLPLHRRLGLDGRGHVASGSERIKLLKPYQVNARRSSQRPATRT